MLEIEMEEKWKCSASFPKRSESCNCPREPVSAIPAYTQLDLQQQIMSAG